MTPDDAAERMEAIVRELGGAFARAVDELCHHALFVGVPLRHLELRRFPHRPGRVELWSVPKAGQEETPLGCVEWKVDLKRGSMELVVDIRGTELDEP